MPFDSIGLQFANSSLNLPKHEDFSAAFLTAQEILGVNLKGETTLWSAAILTARLFARRR
jgi:hypothetical protein